MLTKMQSIYCMLKENGHELYSICCYLYTALKTGPNIDFNVFMDYIVDNIQSGCGVNHNITCDKFIIAAQTKYHHIIEDKEWGKVDPRDAKIIAITTKFKKLEKDRVKINVAANDTDGLTGGYKMNHLEEWHKKFDGSKKIVAKRTYY